MGNTLFSQPVLARHLKDTANGLGDQVLVLSGIRRVDSGHILFKIVRWRTIQMLGVDNANFHYRAV